MNCFFYPLKKWSIWGLIFEILVHILPHMTIRRHDIWYQFWLHCRIDMVTCAKTLDIPVKLLTCNYVRRYLTTYMVSIYNMIINSRICAKWSCMTVQIAIYFHTSTLCGPIYDQIWTPIFLGNEKQDLFLKAHHEAFSHRPWYLNLRLSL